MASILLNLKSTHSKELLSRNCCATQCAYGVSVFGCPRYEYELHENKHRISAATAVCFTRCRVTHHNRNRVPSRIAKLYIPVKRHNVSTLYNRTFHLKRGHFQYAVLPSARSHCTRILQHSSSSSAVPIPSYKSQHLRTYRSPGAIKHLPRRLQCDGSQ